MKLNNRYSLFKRRYNLVGSAARRRSREEIARMHLREKRRRKLEYL